MCANKQHQGFTLIELSIVLVIIGLLIGGVLVAKSMIESGKINKIISEAQQIDIAKNLFVTNYKTLPGDSVNSYMFGQTFGAAGDGDWVVEYNADGIEEEGIFFYQNMRDTQMLKGTWIDDTHIGAGIQYYKDAAIDNAHWMVKDDACWGGGWRCGTWGAFFALAAGDLQNESFYMLGNSGPTVHPGMNNIIPIGILHGVDAKIDDGLPNIGSIRLGDGSPNECQPDYNSATVTYPASCPNGGVLVMKMDNSKVN